MFQRGVGIVEARLQTADGVHIAKIASSSIGKGSVAPPAATTAAAPVPARVPVTSVSQVTPENPVLVVSSESDPAGLKLELLVINTVDKLLPFNFNSSKTYDFIITDPATDKEIWRSSHGMMYAQAIRSDSIRASSKWTFSEVWNRRDNDRNPVPPGKYRLTGILSSQPPIQSKPVLIEVQ